MMQCSNGTTASILRDPIPQGPMLAITTRANRDYDITPTCRLWYVPGPGRIHIHLSGPSSGKYSGHLAGPLVDIRFLWNSNDLRYTPKAGPSAWPLVYIASRGNPRGTGYPPKLLPDARDPCPMTARTNVYEYLPARVCITASVHPDFTPEDILRRTHDAVNVGSHFPRMRLRRAAGSCSMSSS